MTTIFKITTKAEWQQAQTKGLFEGSVDDKRDGFIHLSNQQQLRTTLDKHFKGQKDLILLAFEDSDLGPSLKWEPSRDDQLFPHLYAPLPTDHVLWEKPISQQSDGTHILDIPGMSTE